MDIVHFRVDCLGVLVVFLFPILQLCYELLAPLQIIIKIQLLDPVGRKQLPDLIDAVSYTHLTLPTKA